MLSFETEDRLANFFLYLSSEYKEADLIKGRLNTHLNFDPFAIFSRLDRKAKGHIDINDISDFFNSHAVYATDLECGNILTWFDNNNDGVLTYGEFLNLILADETRNLSNINCVCKCIRGVMLHPEIENILCDLLCKELLFNRNAKNMLLNVRCRFDFDIQKLFSALTSTAFITKENMRKFMIRTKLQFTENDIDNIMKKCSIEKTGRITFSDIQKIFELPLDEINYAKYSTSIEANNYQTLSTLGNKSMYDEFKTSSSLRSNGNNFASPQSDTQTSINRSSSKIVSPPQTLLKDLLELIYITEIEIEEAKTQLAFRSDFNVEDAFRAFEPYPNPTNVLTEEDLFNGLNSLGLYPTNGEVKLLLRKYSLMNTETLNYADFFDMVTPFNKQYRIMVEQRKPSPYTPKYSKSDFFLGVTKKLLGDLFEKIIIGENKIEIIRKRIGKSFTINVREFAEKIDGDKKGYISHFNLRKFYKENLSNIADDFKGIDLSFIRFDRNRDGKVEYDDIVRECKQIYN